MKTEPLDWSEHCLAIFIAVFLVLCAIEVIDITKAARITPMGQVAPSWKRPEIPDCGIETWDEIRGKCSNE